jgi:hypothetical protein
MFKRRRAGHRGRPFLLFRATILAASAVNSAHAIGANGQAAICFSRDVLVVAETAAFVAAVVGCGYHGGAAQTNDRKTGSIALRQCAGWEASAARSG